MTQNAENAARPVSADYAAGLLFAADVAHAEARWQAECAMRWGGLPDGAKHRFAADRAASIEKAIRAVAACVTPSEVGAS